MRLKNRISLIVAVAVLLFPVLASAATDSPVKSDGYNMLLISLVSLMLILLFVIGMLGNTLRQLSLVISDKIKKDRKAAKNVARSVLLLLALSIPALKAVAAGATAVAQQAVAPVSNYIDGIAKDDFYAIITFITLELLVIFALVIYIRVMLRIISGKPELAAAGAAVVHRSWFWDKFNAAATLEQEKDVLLDHNYDGIQELDNSLPPWWKYGFYLTIVVAFIYIYRYHVSHDGMSQQEEYVTEMEQGEADKAAYLAMSANNVDESTVTVLTEPVDISAGKEIFVKTCAACHLADGGGAVGPNLTDEYWLHSGGIKDIFKSIKYGWQDKGMKSWKDDFSPIQIQQLASYIRTLKGTHPAVPKAAQGEIYIEATTDAKDAKPAADTAKAVAAPAKQ